MGNFRDSIITYFKIDYFALHFYVTWWKLFSPAHFHEASVACDATVPKISRIILIHQHFTMQRPRGRCERKWTACRKEKNNVNYGLEFRVLSFKEPWRSVILSFFPWVQKKQTKKDNPYLLTNITQNWGQTTSSPDLKIRCTSDANTTNTFPLERDKRSERQKVHMCCDICPLYFRLAYLMFLKGRKRIKEASLFMAPIVTYLGRFIISRQLFW